MLEGAIIAGHEDTKYSIASDGGKEDRERRGSRDKIRIGQWKWKRVRFVEKRGVFFIFKEKSEYNYSAERDPDGP